MIYAISILVGFALVVWFVADILSFWFPERFEKIKQRLYLRGARRFIDERDAVIRGVREAAIYIAEYSFRSGKGVAESVEDAIAFIRSRTKEWKNEEELRHWLVVHLNTDSSRSLTDLSIMKTSAIKRDRIVVMSIGFIAGICLGGLTCQKLVRSDDFTIQIMNQVTALKINKRTGETWEYDRRNKMWTPIGGNH